MFHRTATVLLSALLVATLVGCPRTTTPAPPGGPVPPKTHATLVCEYQLAASDVLPGQNMFRAGVVVEPWVYGLSRTGTLFVYPLCASVAMSQSAIATTIGAVGDGNDLELIDRHLVFSYSGGIAVYSLADPSKPALVGRFPSAKTTASQTLTRDGSRLFVIGNGHIACFDVADITKPRLLFESNSGHYWCCGSVVGPRLYVGELDVSASIPPPAGTTPRSGVAVMEIGQNDLREVAFAPVPGLMHLFSLDQTHLLACLDIPSTTLNGPRPFGRAAVVDVTDPLAPVVGKVQLASADRSAAFASRTSGNVLIGPGVLIRIKGGSMLDRETFQTSSGGEVDGAPYHGKVNGDWVAIPSDETLSVVKLWGDQPAPAAPPAKKPETKPGD